MSDGIKAGMRVGLLVDGKSLGGWITLSQEIDGRWLLLRIDSDSVTQIGPVDEAILKPTKVATVRPKPTAAKPKNAVSYMDDFGRFQ